MAGDFQLTSGEYYDEFTLQGQAGQTVTLTLTSTAFDPYLIVVHPDGQQTENDDMANGNLNSQVILTLPAAGQYRVLVTTYTPGEGGAYQLTAN
ncbi:MAG: PPC domain-containing protein [Candidatus Sumerlaeia bacterium]|nr:PPC domain-containing protein [Candidatus Sumerlaeia bacterium]